MYFQHSSAPERWLDQLLYSSTGEASISATGFWTELRTPFRSCPAPFFPAGPASLRRFPTQGFLGLKQLLCVRARMCSSFGPVQLRPGTFLRSGNAETNCWTGLRTPFWSHPASFVGRQFLLSRPEWALAATSHSVRKEPTKKSKSQQ